MQALEVVNRHRWAIDTIQDLLAVRDIIKKSALRVVDPEVSARMDE